MLIMRPLVLSDLNTFVANSISNIISHIHVLWEAHLQGNHHHTKNVCPLVPSALNVCVTNLMNDHYHTNTRSLGSTSTNATITTQNMCPLARRAPSIYVPRTQYVIVIPRTHVSCEAHLQCNHQSSKDVPQSCTAPSMYVSRARGVIVVPRTHVPWATTTTQNTCPLAPCSQYMCHERP